MGLTGSMDRVITKMKKSKGFYKNKTGLQPVSRLWVQRISKQNFFRSEYNILKYVKSIKIKNIEGYDWITQRILVCA